MIDTGFLNENLIRAFPFVLNERADVPNWLVVDFRAIVLEGVFDPRKHRIALAWVARFNDRLRFGFRTDAPDLADQELVFERSLADDGRFITEFAESQPLLVTVEQRCGCSEELLCNTNFTDDSTCGPDLLCNASQGSNCGPELLCNLIFVPDPPDCIILQESDGLPIKPENGDVAVLQEQPCEFLILQEADSLPVLQELEQTGILQENQE